MTQKRTRSRKAASAPVAPGLVDLGTACTLREAPALRTRLLAALESADPPALDGREVAHVDTAGLQVLVGFTIDCMERSLHFTWVGRSAPLASAIRLLGLEALIESPGLAASPAGGAA